MGSRQFPVTPTVTAGAYAQNDSVGGVFSVNIGQHEATLMDITMIDEADQGPSFEVWLFEDEPTGVADNAAFTLTDADLLKVTGVVSVDTWFDAINGQVLTVDNIGKTIRTVAGVLYIMLKVTDASAPTFAATDDLTLKLGVIF